ncbi:MAG: GNAT family N-acetyltransferase [Bryobacteraceae bacterium]|nr:GNAT family N-acetyltransferase [Bryobacteraceae bacterium]MDW8379270.1 GNAT family N-acetyltransferase [Bryobacterales bacterium]
MGEPGIEPVASLLGRECHPLDVFFRPRSVAVVGASEAPGSVGRATFWNLISSPFGGVVYPVHPKRNSVLGVKAYSSVLKIAEAIDLAVIATPAQAVPGVIRECVEAGVKGAIILAAGFRELGPAGLALEQQVVEEARKGALRIVGPNCLGVMSPVTGLNATFASCMARPGSVAFLSQSGALCTAVLDWGRREMVGFSAFVSTGSMADLGWGDWIEYLGQDPSTRSILIYMESVGDPGGFLSAAREVSFGKPILVIKAGRTAGGAKAAAAHTGAQAGNDEVVDAALRRCGVLRVHQLSELFYMAEVLGKQPRPRGKRLAIVTNAGGPGVLAADALIRAGGELAPLAEETQRQLNEALPPEWSHNNPVDILGDAPPERFAKAIEIVAKDPNTDGVLAVLAPQAATDATRTAEQLRPFARLSGKPFLASWMGACEVASGASILQAADIPTFPYPDTAARMFLYMWAHHENLRAIYETPALEPTQGDLPPGDPRTLLEGKEVLSEAEIQQLVDAYALRLPVGCKLTVGSFVDEQFGPALFVESSAGRRAVGLPPLTTTLAGLMLDQLGGLDAPRQSMEQILVRLGRMVVEQPRIERCRLSAREAQIVLHPSSKAFDSLPKPAIRPYPLEYVDTWKMKNGETVIIRPIRPEDEPLIARFHETLSERTVYFRYLSALKLSTRIAHERLVRICFIDYARQIALVVEWQNRIIAVARLYKDPQAYARGRREAEFALVVSDEFQGLGLGKELLRRILDIARKEGVETLFGEISAENQRMQAICRAIGFRIRRDFTDTTVIATLQL